jgi:hypothetical protein
MAKDPKNFTGEDMQRLLASDKKRERAKAEWSLLGSGFVILVGAVLLIGGVVGLVVSFLG